MRNTLLGLLALAVVASPAFPAYAQQTQPGTEQAQPGQPTEPGETEAQPSEGIDKPQKQQAMREGLKPGKRGMQSPEAQAMQAAQMITQGGEEADKMQFQALDSHLQMLDRSIRQIQQLANQPEQNAADITRWAALRDEHARGVEDVVAGYFLAQRMLPPALLHPGMDRQAREQAQPQGAEPSEQQKFHQAYQDQLQTAHEILTHTYLAKATSDPQHVQHLRQLTTQLRQGMQQYNQQVMAQLNQMKSQMGQETQQAGRATEPGAEPGIDQPEERRAQREGQGQGAQPQQPQTPPTTPEPGAGTQ